MAATLFPSRNTSPLPKKKKKKSFKGRGGVLYTSILAQSTSEKLSSKKTNTCQKWFSRFQEKKLLQGSHNLFKDAVEWLYLWDHANDTGKRSRWSPNLFKSSGLGLDIPFCFRDPVLCVYFLSLAAFPNTLWSQVTISDSWVDWWKFAAPQGLEPADLSVQRPLL